jgi:WD40 repeat protein
VQLWNGELQPIAQVRPAQPIATMTFSRDGRILATGSESGMIRLWDSSTGEAIGQPMQGLQSVVTKIAFSDDGRYIAAACSCEALRLWDTGTFQSVGEDMRLDSVPRAVAFSPDGTTVASGGDDGAIQFWDAGNQTELGAPFAGHEGVVNSLDFSPDGTKLLSAGDDYSLRMWPVPPHSLDDAREVLCSKITHNMSKPKWNKEVSPNIKYERGCPGLPESDWSE